MATVIRAVARLSTSGVVVSAGLKPSTGGRPSELLSYNGVGLMAAGISVTERSASGVLLSLDGEAITRAEEIFSPQEGPDVRLARTIELAKRLLANPDGRVCGLGVGVPGVVGPTGRLSAIHEIGWDRLALGDLLSRQTKVPVVVENDANCLAVAEHLRGAGRGVDNLVAIVVSSGLGAGLITNGQLYRGLHHEAGEIGYLLTERSSLRRLFPDRGELEQLIGGDRLLQKGREFGLPSPDQATLAHLISLGVGSDGAAREFSDELLDLSALAISAMCVVLDPELVIIGGSGDELDMNNVITGVRERLPGRILRVPRMEAAALGKDAIMVGAAQLALPSLV